MEEDPSNDPPPTDDSSKPQLVVGLAASAGGLSAFRGFVSKLRPGQPIAYVLVQHLDPTHDSLTAELLAAVTTLPVSEIVDDEHICAEHIYIIPPNRYLSIQQGQFKLKPPASKHVRMPVDEFFKSLAAEFGEHSIAVVLSGTGSDGSIGLRNIKEAGGVIIAQDPGTAEFDGMPSSAVRTGLCDFVSLLEEIPSIVSNYAAHAPSVRKVQQGGSELEKLLAAVMAILRTSMQHDFRHYKKGTLIRRIQRRMGLASITEPDAYIQLLRRDPVEVHELYHDLLIGVTSFFRDAEAFEALSKAIQDIAASKSNQDQFRVWVPGCSTGEEAYSIAMLIQSACDNAGSGIHPQIFATDVDERALDIARQGRYPKSAVTGIPTQFLNQYFTSEGDDYRFSQSLRERMVFAVQNLISDAPFSRLDLISCRNVLIYIDSETQDRLLGLFHFALDPHGHLFLGSTESTSRVSNLYAPVSKKWRLYRKVGSSAVAGAPFPAREQAQIPDLVRRTSITPDTASSLAQLARNALLNSFAPTSVLIDHKFQIDYYHGETSDFLSLPSGEPTRSLLDMARDGLRTRLRAAVQRAAREGVAVQTSTKRMRRDGRYFGVLINVRPIELKHDEQRFLVSFAYADGQPEEAVAVELVETDDVEVRELEGELLATKEDLQSTIEELEASNEELRAANEEVMSMNEETQSSNEELETSREELQSLNEELSTLNNQLEEKLLELETANDDLSNLLVSTNLAMIFLDNEGRIRRFTPETTRLLNVIPADIGRPLKDLAPKVDDPALLKDVALVLTNLSPIEANITAGEQSYIRRILPYRTHGNRINGVAITYANVTALQTALERAQTGEIRQTAISLLARRLVFDVADLESLLRRTVVTVGNSLLADESEFWETHTATGELRLKTSMSNATPGAESIAVEEAPHSLPGSIAEKKRVYVSANLQRHEHPQSKEIFAHASSVRALVIPVLAHDDLFGAIAIYRCEADEFTDDEIEFAESIATMLAVIVERARYQFAIAASESLLQDVTRQMGMSSAIINADGCYEYASNEYAQFLGSTSAAIVGHQASEFWPADADVVAQKHLSRAAMGESVAFEYVGQNQLEGLFGAKISFTPRRSPAGLVNGVYVATLDLTAIKQAEVSRLLADTSEQERRRIGQELHTSVGQALTGLSMLAESTARSLEQSAGDEAVTARRVSEGLTDVLEHVRRIARGLDVVSENLLGELKALASDVAAIESLDCEFIGPDQLQQPSDATASSLYRIAQEAVANAVRHAAASRITISLEAETGWLKLCVADDGKGITKQRDKAEGLGLRIMRYRANLLKGHLSLEPRARGGTQVICRVPIEGAQ